MALQVTSSLHAVWQCIRGLLLIKTVFDFFLGDSFLNMYCLSTLSTSHQLIHMFMSDQTTATMYVF